MSEYSPHNYETSDDIKAIVRLRNDFYFKGGSYFDMLLALQEYAEQYLGIKERESQRYLMALEDRGFLPSEELYDIDPEAALEKHRLAVYTCYMPLYQLTHTSEEFEAWIRYALQIVVPENGRHKEGVCNSYKPDDGWGNEGCCLSEQCPIRHIEREIVFGLCQSNMDTTDYVLNSAKACQDTQLLINATQEHGIITASQKAAAERAYQRRYSKEFPDPDVSQ